MFHESLRGSDQHAQNEKARREAEDLAMQIEDHSQRAVILENIRGFYDHIRNLIEKGFYQKAR